MPQVINKYLEIQTQLKLVKSSLEKLETQLNILLQEEKKELYKEMPGVEGYFDGTYLVQESGSKIEVPVNYAAKSKIIYGDRLKMIEEEGKQLFKQIQKQEKDKLQGALIKKEGKWYVATEKGTYKVMDIAVEYAKLTDKSPVTAIIPKGNYTVPFAALDTEAVLAVEKKESPVKADTPVKEPTVKVEPKPSIRSLNDDDLR